MIKPRLTDDAILTGADGFAPTPRNNVEAISPFFDDEEVNLEMSLQAASKGKKHANNSHYIAEDDDNRSNTSSESSDEEYFAARKRAIQKDVVPVNRVRTTKPLQRLTDVDLYGADPAPSMITPSGGMKVPISPFLEDSEMEQLQAHQARARIASKPAKQEIKSSPSVIRHPTKTPQSSGSIASSSATQRLSLGRMESTRLSMQRPATDSPSIQASPAVKRAWSSSLRADTRSVASSPGRVSVASTVRGAKASPLKIDLTRPTTVGSPNVSQYASPSIRAVASASSMGRRPMTSARLSTASEPQYEQPSHISVGATNDEWMMERRELQSRARKAEKQLAFMLILSATRRRRDKLLRYYFRRWRAIARPTMEVPDHDDAEALANELLNRLKSFRRET